MYPAMTALACPIFYFLPLESNLLPDWLVLMLGGAVHAQWIFSACLPQRPLGPQCRHLMEVLHLSCGPSMALPLCHADIFCWTHWASCFSCQLSSTFCWCRRQMGWQLMCTSASLFFMVALCNRADHYIFPLWFLSSSFFFFFFFSSPNLSGRRLDVYHTSTHGVALVRI